MSERKPFKTRLFASIFIWLMTALLVGVIGFFLWLLPSRDGFQVLGKDLPPRSDLNLTEGKFVDMGHYVLRRTQYLKPKIAYQIEGETYHFQTVAGYSASAFPFQQGHKAEVLYMVGQPEKAWLKWEYENLKNEYQEFSLGLIGEKIKAYYNHFALGILGISGLFLFVNLFFPILRRLK